MKWNMAFNTRAPCKQTLISFVMLLAVGSTQLALIVGLKRYALPTSLTWKRQIIEKNLDAEVLILGSSHTVMGIAPSLFKRRAVSLAGVSQDLYYNCGLARRYVPLMHRLRVLVIDAEIAGWQGLTQRSIESWRISQYYYEYGIPPANWNLGAFKELKSFAIKGPTQVVERDPFDKTGWGPVEGKLDLVSGKVAAERHLRNIRQSDAEAHLADLTKLLQDCTGRGIEVVLVTTPAHSCYRQCMVDTAAFRGFHEMVNKIRTTFELKYLDHFADERFTDEDFFDGDHLNVGGAEKFTRILADELAEGK